MSIVKRKFFVPVLVAVFVLGTLALVVARSRSNRGRLPSPQVSSPTFLVPQTKSATPGNGARNLSLQPEAFNLGRRLGARFSASKLETSTLTGTLTTGSEQRTMQTARTQTEKGEQVSITFPGSTSSLTWDAAEGAVSSSSPASGTDRELIERLVFDSPDQFVLAQLRGASYYTVARNVRPAGASDKYSGPLWNIVRVNDPQPDETKQPLSRWRLYYINTMTGLIDKIESEVAGQRIIAEISWTNLNGENVPAQIIWTNQGQPLMQYSLTNVSIAEK